MEKGNTHIQKNGTVIFADAHTVFVTGGNPTSEWHNDKVALYKGLCHESIT